MPNLYRTTAGEERKPSVPLLFQLADGQMVEATWAGSAQDEKLAWWLRQPGNQLVQTETVAAIAVKADDNGEMIWGDAPAEARLIFVLEAQAPGKSYRLAKMVTTAATAAQTAYFRHERFALFGHLLPDGRVDRVEPPAPPAPRGPAQRELF